jgi:hypothetical protein
MTKIVELIISEEQKEDMDGVFAISLVEDPAIEEFWVALNKQKEQIQFTKVDEDKRLLIAPALVPNKQIFRLDDDGSDYHVFFSKETIKKASELFMKRNHLQSATFEHEKEVDGLCVVESWVKEFEIDKSVKYGFEHCPVGTWFVTMRVDNDKIWDKVKNGEVLGFSIEGFFTDKMQSLSKRSLSQDETRINQVKELIMKSEEEYLADYPWEQCIADQKSDGHSQDVAQKICGAIKNRTIASKVVPQVKAIIKGERKKTK